MDTFIIKSDGTTVECVSVPQYASLIHRSVTAVRHLLFDGNNLRKMRGIEVHGHIYIPVAEIEGYPHLKPGLAPTDVFHDMKVDEEVGTGAPIYDRLLCPACSSGKMCDKRTKAESLPEMFVIRPSEREGNNGTDEASAGGN